MHFKPDDGEVRGDVSHTTNLIVLNCEGCNGWSIFFGVSRQARLIGDCMKAPFQGGDEDLDKITCKISVSYSYNHQSLYLDGFTPRAVESWR